MKKKLFLIIAFIAIFSTLFSACDVKNQSSLNSLTRPYIAQYECTEATYGGVDIKDKFEYIEIILKDKENLELIYKPVDGEKHTHKSKYNFNTETRELSAEIGILGYRFKPVVKIQNGRFTVTQQIGAKPLILKFKAK